MSERGRAQLWARLVSEIAVWYLFVGVFLSVYVGNVGAPAASIAPHLRIVTDVFLAIGFVRIALVAARPSSATLRLLSSLLFVAATAALLLFYMAALVGLKSWGRVTTWELLSSYSAQLPLLLDAMGIPLAAALGAVLLALAVIAAFAWLHASRWDWVSIAALRGTRASVAFGAVALALIAVADLYQSTLVPPVLRKEPMGLGLLAIAGIVALAWPHARRWNWVSTASSSGSGIALAFVSLVLALIAAMDVSGFMVLPPVQLRQEPISLSIYPAGGAVGMQSHGIDRAVATRRDNAEDAARAAYRPRTDPGNRNVILIVADALRADHMGIYGYPRDTTPNLSRLQAEGRAQPSPVVHAACGESACGLLSIASARYIHQFGSRMFVLHEVLARHGYRISMILGGDHTHFYGLKEQYGRVDTYFDASSAAAGYMNDDRVVLDHLAAMPDWDGRPVAMQFHLMSSHMLGKRHPPSMVFEPSANYFIRANRTEAGSDAPSKRAINFYDNGVRQADAVIMELLETLRRKGYLRDALVAVTADHGEGLGEHGIWLHQQGVYREILGIPFLMIAYGDRAPRPLVAHALPSQVDIAPTLLEELGLPIPSSWSGKPLQGASLGDFAYFQQGPLIGLLDRRDAANPWKYWEDRRDGSAFAFNLRVDPSESRNAISSVPDPLKREWQLKVLAIKAQDVAGPSAR